MATILKRMQKAYLEAVIFTECDGDDQPSDAEFSESAKLQAHADCRNLAWANDDIITGDNCEQAAHDLWLTRNGHGAGFWDRDADTYGGASQNNILTRCAKSMGPCDMYQGDDGLLYFA